MTSLAPSPDKIQSAINVKLLRVLLKFGLVLLTVGLFAGVMWSFRGPILREAAHAWIVNDSLTSADIIVVLGGGPETRPFEAAHLFHLGLAPKILLTNPKPGPSALLGLAPTDAERARSVLLKKEVPTSAIFITDDYVTDSFDEAIAVRNWARANHVRRLIIVTDIFHTRRVRWLFNKELHSLGVHVQVDAVPVLEYTEDDWWRHEQGVISFQNEVLKYVYYRMKY